MADSLAVLSLVISGGAFGWTMYRDMADRASLRIGCFIGRMAGRGVTDQRDYVVWSITNSGRRTIVVQHVGGEYVQKDKTFILVPHSPLPRSLRPYETFTEYSDDLASLKDLKSLCAWDTLGHIYRAPKSKLKRVKQELAKGGAANRGTITPASPGGPGESVPPEEDY